MNITYTVHFRGVPENFSEALDKMIRDDIAVYPDRMSIESAVAKQVVKKNA